MKNKTILLIVFSLAATAVAYLCWNKKKEWLSGLGLGTGMLNSQLGPSYEGFTLDNTQDKKEGYCGACS